MNPSGRYEGFENSEYQVIDMDPAQEDRFVWLYMDSEPKEWISWGMSSDGNIHPHISEFISNLPTASSYPRHKGNHQINT